MVKKAREARRITTHVNLEDYEGLILAYPELSRVRKLLESARQGVVKPRGSYSNNRLIQRPGASRWSRSLTIGCMGKIYIANTVWQGEYGQENRG